MSVVRLNKNSLVEGVKALCRRDRALARWVSLDGLPPMWGRRPGFATLIRIILEQQVSLASAKAVFLRLQKVDGGVRPSTMIALGVSGMRSLGLTRQKATYCHLLAESVEERRIDLARLAVVSDDEARSVLKRIKGVGPWTADIYLLMALRRPDVWPSGDLALLSAMKSLKNLRHRPEGVKAASIAREWSPWRSVAARILWQGYLNGRCI